MNKNPKVLGITLDPKLTYSNQIKIASEKARGRLNIIQALSGVDWGKDKETITDTYKALIRPVLEYGSSVWGPVASATSLQKAQVVQNRALRVATGHTRDTNVVHLHDETAVLPLKEHIKMRASQTREGAALQQHPSLHLLAGQPPPRLMKKTIYNSDYPTKLQTCHNHQPSREEVRRNQQVIHTNEVRNYLESRPLNKILDDRAPLVDSSERSLGRRMRRVLAQLRAGKCPLLQSYLNNIDEEKHPTPTCPLCSSATHDTKHLFSCTEVPTTLVPRDLWEKPVDAASLVRVWQERLGAPEGGGGRL